MIFKRNIKKGIRTAALCFLMLGSAKTVHALSVTPSSVPSNEIVKFLAERSDLIVVGELGDNFASLGTYPRMGQDQTIITGWEVKIKTVLKGELKDQVISVIVPGGCLPEKELCLETDAFPELKTGEEMMLFLKPVGNGSWFVFDIMHGFQWEKEGQFRPLGQSLQEIRNIIEGGAR